MEKQALTVRLRMYDLEEVLEAVSQLEQGISAAVTLGRSLFLQQVCGWPLISDMRSDVVVVAVPKYDVPGCQGHLYTSVIVVRVRSALGFLSGIAIRARH